MKTEKIYVYCENCCSSGHVYSGDYAETNGDVWLWGEGTEPELIEQALGRLTQRNDTRPGGAGDRYDWKCCRRVLDYFSVKYELAVWKNVRYASDNGWTSEDGDNWIDEDGEPVTGADFDGYRIAFRGGPRAGTVVACAE